MESQESQVENPLETFPPQIREDVNGLLWLGHLDAKINFCGHEFVLRTLKGEEELNAALISKEYIESLGQAKAWAWAVVALSLVSIDGDSSFCPPIGPSGIDFARGRFRYVTKNWFWPTGEYLYSEYAKLLERQVEAIRAVQDLSEGSRPTSSPSADSLIDLGTLIEEVTRDET